MKESSTSRPKRKKPVAFSTTRWNLIDDVKRGGSRGEIALNELYTIYRMPVIRYIVHLGQPEQDAQDLAQEFFRHSLKKQLFKKSNPQRGKLRTLICVCLNRFITDRARHHNAKKRGGGQHPLPVDISQIESWLEARNGRAITPADHLARECGLILLKQVTQDLREFFREKNEEHIYEALAPFLAGGGPNQRTQVEVAKSIKSSPRAFNNRLRRLRRQFLNLLKHRVAQEVGSDEEVDEAIRDLRRLFNL